MAIFKCNYENFGEGEKVIDLLDIEEFRDLRELINSDDSLKEHIIDVLCKQGVVNGEDVFSWYNGDMEILRICSENKSKEEFIRDNYHITTLEDLKNSLVEPGTIYLFRDYRYSASPLLATFEGFNSVTEVKHYCVDNNLNFSEYQGSQCSLHELNNCYFKIGNDKFDLDELEAIRVAENAKHYTKGE